MCALNPGLQHWLWRYKPLARPASQRREAPSDPSLEREWGRERIEAGREGWLQPGLEDGANLEAFALFLCVCLNILVETLHSSMNNISPSKHIGSYHYYPLLQNKKNKRVSYNDK